MNDLKNKLLWAAIHKLLRQILGGLRGDAEFLALQHFAGLPDVSTGSQ